MLGFKEIDIAIAEAKLCVLRDIPKKTLFKKKFKKRTPKALAI